jgi:putative DNA primase/helicase
MEKTFPEQLRNNSFRFIKLVGNTKNPKEKEWQKSSNYAWNDTTLQEHIKAGNNYGVLGGYGNLLLIDADKEPLISDLKKLPRTFTVKSPHGLGIHKYYIARDTSSVVLFDTIEDANGIRENIGNIRGDRGMLVGPGSSVFDCPRCGAYGKDIEGIGEKIRCKKCSYENRGEQKFYTIIDNSPIAEIEREEINTALKAYFKKSHYEKPKKSGHFLFANPNIQGIMDVVKNAKELHDEGGGRYRGKHPINHPNDKDRDDYFVVDANENTWYCHVDSAGGSIFELIAVQEGIIKCQDCTRGALRGEKFLQTLRVAREKYGIKIETISGVRLHDTDYYLIVDEKTNKVKINEKLFADDLINIYHFKTLSDTEEVLYYEDGYYHFEGETIIGAECERIFGTYIKTRNVIEILNHIRRSTYINRRELNKDKQIIVIENGVFNLDTFSLENFDPNILTTYKLPVTYNPNADCPRIKKFISEILNPEDIPVVQQFFGYALYPSLPAHKSLWMYGIGRNGKSSLIRLLTALLGDDSVTSVPIEELDGWHRFSVARLYGKLLNVASEPGTARPLESAVLKKLLGGDNVSAEIKGKQRTINFRNIAKFIIHGNIFPQVNDTTLAFWDRIIVVEFPNIFLNNFIPDIADKLIKEEGLSGFFNWCLEGLKQLKNNNFHFPSTKNIEQMKLEFEKVSNPFSAFIKERCLRGADLCVPKGALYDAYKDYCVGGGYEIIGKGAFSKKMGELPGISSTKARYGGKVVHCWRGIECAPIIEVNGSVDNVYDVDVSPSYLAIEEEVNRREVTTENVNLDNNVNTITKIEETPSQAKESKQVTKPVKRVNIDNICVCGFVASSLEELQKHQAVCNEYQREQAKEAREQLRKAGLLEVEEQNDKPSSH